MNYEHKKRLFKYIVSKDYKIKKHEESNNIFFIIFKTFEIKCKYFLLFNSMTVENKDNILWACDNPYTSLDTHKICQKIRDKINDEKINDTKQIIQTIIKKFDILELNEKTVNLLWIIEDKKNNYSSFYVITEIIYF